MINSANKKQLNLIQTALSHVAHTVHIIISNNNGSYLRILQTFIKVTNNKQLNPLQTALSHVAHTIHIIISNNNGSYLWILQTFIKVTNNKQLNPLQTALSHVAHTINMKISLREAYQWMKILIIFKIFRITRRKRNTYIIQYASLSSVT